MNDDEFGCGLFFGTIFGIALGLIVLWGLEGCSHQGVKSNQKEAVKVGVGKWVPQPDGSTVFEWITPEKK